MVIAFGGANWEGVMGQELHRRFSFVDVAFSGEADESFPALLASLETGTPLAAIPGIVYRDRSRSVATEPRPVLDLDTLAVPSFDDYFRDLDASASGIDVCPRLMAETARGCWWGAISHCTFCGLNGATMAFRSKSPARVVAELYELHHRHGIDALSVVDNILDMRYFRSVLPALAEGPRLDLFWEVKANLSREQVCTLAAAGVNHVQPGIESMSDHVLGLLGKGTTVFRNVELLKWGREYGIHMDWNLLFGVLGEEPDDYTDQARLFRALTHLEPPSACGPIRFDRFSPTTALPRPTASPACGPSPPTATSTRPTPRASAAWPTTSTATSRRAPTRWPWPCPPWRRWRPGAGTTAAVGCGWSRGPATA